MDRATITYRTVLHPNFNPFPDGNRRNRVEPRLSDYVAVPRLSLRGMWRTDEMLPDSTRLAMVKLWKELNKRRTA